MRPAVLYTAKTISISIEENAQSLEVNYSLEKYTICRGEYSLDSTNKHKLLCCSNKLPKIKVKIYKLAIEDE